MKVFKFGGASIKSAEAIRNMCLIVKAHCNEKLVVVVSAMDKTTNQLERILEAKNNDYDYSDELNSLENYHANIARDLGENFQSESSIDDIFHELRGVLKEDFDSQAEAYDQIISFGELLSSRIIYTYLKTVVPNFSFVDIRTIIRTDSQFRDAQVNWDITTANSKSKLAEDLKSNSILTQGFIGADSRGNTTTLGREGSDFTGAILASILGAKSLTVWKDVPGILNADPKKLQDTIKFDDISYEEAAEMTYYGAKVIHPKTIKPLANKGIPLYVRPFLSPSEKGTCIHDVHVHKPHPSIIFKENQTLLSFRVDDFTFINEKNLTQILHAFTLSNIRINLMQNSALSFSVCIDTNPIKLEELNRHLGGSFSIFYNDKLLLITIQNYDEESIRLMSSEREILLEQRSRQNFQLVVR